jgi:hypothetical protein
VRTLRLSTIKVNRVVATRGELKTKRGRSSKQLCTIEVNRAGAILISISDAGKRVWRGGEEAMHGR